MALIYLILLMDQIDWGLAYEDQFITTESRVNKEPGFVRHRYKPLKNHVPLGRVDKEKDGVAPLERPMCLHNAKMVLQLCDRRDRVR